MGERCGRVRCLDVIKPVFQIENNWVGYPTFRVIPEYVARANPNNAYAVGFMGTSPGVHEARP
jgi:hypothetical protein